MSVLVPEEGCQGFKSPWAEGTAVRPFSRMQAVVGAQASRTWTAVATHVTTARVPAPPKPLHACQVAMLMKEQL